MHTPPPFATFFATQLNETQQKIIIPARGIFVVKAGAGSGKTRVVTARIVRLMLTDELGENFPGETLSVSADQIVALTFTNKAAREMQERLTTMLPFELSAPQLGTFHSYALRLLKRYGSRIGLDQFTIIDTTDKEQLLKSILKRSGGGLHGRTLTASSLASTISRHKNDITRCTSIGIPPLRSEPKLVQDIFQTYEREKQSARALDFDDLLVEALRLFQITDFKESFQRTVRHLLIDEYQDTNRIQHALMREMSHGTDGTFALDSLCIVGDEDQSIYSWRGATVDNLLSFSSEFPNSHMITIAQNYRSVQPILDVANAIIQNNRNRDPKELWSRKLGENRVKLVTCASGYHESELIAQTLRSLIPTQRLCESAILYRSHYQSRSLEEALIRNSVPYKIIGGTQFYDRQEIKDILAYLRLSVNPYDRIAFTRVINVPSRGLGEAFLSQWNDVWAAVPDGSVFKVAETMLSNKTLRPAQEAAVKNFINIIATATQCSTAATALDSVLEATQFTQHLDHQYDPAEARERTANVNELVNAVAALATRGIVTTATFLDEVVLVQEHTTDTDQEKDFVRLMTIHSAKGLEFDTVIIPGMEEGICPSSHTLYNPDNVEEERRLLYVAVTRARERLLITHAHERFLYGKIHEQSPSRFLRELPSRHVIMEDYTNWHSRTMAPLASWMSQSSATLPAPLAPESQTPTLPRTRAQAKGTWSTPPSAGISSTPTWRSTQRVHHATFGKGTIVGIDHTTQDTTYLTIHFACGLRKIAASFITATE